LWRRVAAGTVSGSGVRDRRVQAADRPLFEYESDWAGTDAGGAALMVESSIDADDRTRSAFVLKALFTGLVGASAGLVSVQANASLEFVLAAVLAGLCIGVMLTWFVVRNLRRVKPEGLAKRREMERRQRERRQRENEK